MEINVSVHRADGLRKDILRALLAEQERRNDGGLLVVLERPDLIRNAGNREALTSIVRCLCTAMVTTKAIDVHPKDRERWARWSIQCMP